MRQASEDSPCRFADCLFAVGRAIHATARRKSILPASLSNIPLERRSLSFCRTIAGRGSVSRSRKHCELYPIPPEDSFPPKLGATQFGYNGPSSQTKTGGGSFKWEPPPAAVISASRQGRRGTGRVPAPPPWCPCRCARTRCPSSGPSRPSRRRSRRSSAPCGGRRRR